MLTYRSVSGVAMLVSFRPERQTTSTSPLSNIASKKHDAMNLLTAVGRRCRRRQALNARRGAYLRDLYSDPNKNRGFVVSQLHSKVDGGRLSLVQRRAVDAQRTATCESEVKEYEAEQDSHLSRVDDGVERSRRMRHEIGEGHFTRENKRDDPSEGTHEEQGGAERLQNRRKNQDAAERADGQGAGK